MYITDNGNMIIDWTFDKTKDYKWAEISARLNVCHFHLICIKELTVLQFQNLPGVVETGLFTNCVKAAYFGEADGTIKIVENNKI